MAKCIYCGENVSLLRKAHKDCEEIYKSGVDRILKIGSDASISPCDLSLLEKQISDIGSKSFIPPDKRKELIAKAWEDGVKKAIEDGLLSEVEEKALNDFRECFSLSQDILNKNLAYTHFIEAVILREVMEGKMPKRIKIEGTMPFNFQKSESLIWLFQEVPYFETRTKTSYAGGYQGVNIRVAKGVYYKMGGFQGNPVVTTQLAQIDRGILAITNKHLYFAGSIKTFRIPYEKIISIQPYSDGISIQKDGTTAKPQIFVTADGWFTYNLVQNLAQQPNLLG
jgi:hypothetical protein